MIVIGGYNSSNTCNLARICAQRCPTFHIADPECLVSAATIRHRPVGAKERNGDRGLAAAGGAGYGRTDVRGVHAGQSGGRGCRKAGRLLRLTLGGQWFRSRFAVAGRGEAAKAQKNQPEHTHA